MKEVFIRSSFALLISFVVLGALKLATGPTREQRYAASIVKVLNFEGTGGGTGWVTDSAQGKVIITNHHVCAVAKNGYARIESQSGMPSINRVLAQSFERDLCILEGIDAPSLPLAKAGPAKFDQLYVMGHPGLRPTAPATGVYTGDGIVGIGFSPQPTPDAKRSPCPEGEKCVPFIVEDPGYCPSPSEMVQSFFGNFCVLNMELSYSTVPIMPGNSGSPVTNANGEVIGVMNSADSTGNQGMFIPLKYVKALIRAL